MSAWFTLVARVLRSPHALVDSDAAALATLLPRLHRRDKRLTFPQSRGAAYAQAVGQGKVALSRS